MMRQCAWCLRMINGLGERISLAPLPKLYEASHGICCVCGTLWIEQALVTDTAHPYPLPLSPQSAHHPHTTMSDNTPQTDHLSAPQLPTTEPLAGSRSVSRSETTSSQSEPATERLLLSLRSHQRRKLTPPPKRRG